jgi:hypothetical protein
MDWGDLLYAWLSVECKPEMTNATNQRMTQTWSSHNNTASMPPVSAGTAFLLREFAVSKSILWLRPQCS